MIQFQICKLYFLIDLLPFPDLDGNEWKVYWRNFRLKTSCVARRDGDEKRKVIVSITHIGINWKCKISWYVTYRRMEMRWRMWNVIMRWKKCWWGGRLADISIISVHPWYVLHYIQIIYRHMTFVVTLCHEYHDVNISERENNSVRERKEERENDLFILVFPPSPFRTSDWEWRNKWLASISIYIFCFFFWYCFDSLSWTSE